MRIRRKIHLAGLAVALAGGVSGTAEAGDRTVSTGITTPLTTSNPDGSGIAGNITVTDAGSITVTAGQTAITVNTGNNVLIDGTLGSTGANNTTGIVVQGGNVGPNTIENSGAISLLEDYTITDTDSDGNLDGNFAIGTDRHGIFLQAGPTFNGDIINSGNIAIEGNNSSGITLNSLLNGDLRSPGGMSVTGDNSYGIAINGGVTGDVSVTGGMTIRGQNSVGLHVNSDIGGALSLSGTFSVTGYLSPGGVGDESLLDPDDLEQSGSAILINGSVGNGITLIGTGVENDEDDDDDGTNNELDDNNGVVVNQFGSAPAMQIQANGSNLVVDPGTSGWGLLIRGSLGSVGVFENVESTGLYIAGDGLGATTTINGGIAVHNAIGANAREANSYGLHLGADAITPLLEVRGSIVASANSDPAFTAYGVLIDSGADLAEINNNGGIIAATYFGETGDAVAIRDASGTVATFTNSGQITAIVAATDSDLTDDIPPPPITGEAIAIDFSASSGGVLLEQVAPTVFTDDDANDDVVATAASITGDILLGSGADTLNLMSGTITGDIAFGGGADNFNIDNGAVFTGGISDSNGALSINVQQGTLNYTGGTLTITNAIFGADSQFNAFLSSVPAETTNITATGSVTFAAGAVISPVVPEGLPTFGTQTFLTAGQMFGAANVIDLDGIDGGSYLYDIIIDTTNPIVEGGANGLEATFELKTAAELGLSANQAIALDPILAALRLDSDAASAMAAITSQYEFFDAYEDLMPNYADGATEVAATAVQQMQSATSNRMSAVRMQGLDEVSVWGQEIAYGVTRDPPSANAQEFRGTGFGFAGGIDGPTNNGAMFGLSASFIASEVEEPGRPDGQISVWFGQANAYYATAMGPVDLDFIGGMGAGKMQSRRFVEIGNPVAFSALSEADWLAYEAHGAIRASVPLAISDLFTVTPQAALTYVGISEQGYEEEGGGAAIDYRVDDYFSQRLWADVGLEVSANLRLGNQTTISPRIYAGYRANTLDAESERTVAFVSGGSPFTLTDEGVGDGGPLIGIGFDATNGYSTFSFGYEGEFSDQIERHSINAAIRFRF